MGNGAIVAILGALLLFIGGVVFVFRGTLRTHPERIGLVLCAVLWVCSRALNWSGIANTFAEALIALEEIAVIFAIPFLFWTVFGLLGMGGRYRRIVIVLLFVISAGFGTGILIGQPDTGFLAEVRAGLRGASNQATGNSITFVGYLFYLVGSCCLLMVSILARLRYLPPRHANQARLFLFALAVPVLAALLELCSVEAWKDVPFVEIGMSITAIISVYGISNSRQISPIPLAHEAIVDAMIDPVIVTDPNARIVYLNESAKKMVSGMSFHLGMNLRELFPSLEGIRHELLPHDESMIHFAGADYVVRVAAVSGMTPHTVSDAKNSALLFVLHDVTIMTAERGQLEIQVFERTQRLEEEVVRYRDAKNATEQVVSEKETLLQELHHRVKNNLQIVISLINLQVNRMETDTETKAVFLSMKNRIRTISLVHELMHRTRFHSGVDFAAYIRELVQGIASLFSSAPSRLALDLPDGVFVSSMDFCVDMGLVINELVTNAFKHGMEPAGKGMIQVGLKLLENEALFSIQDSGPGFASAHAEQDGSLGMVIARSILHKHRARMEIHPGPGGHVELYIPLLPDGLSRA